MKSKTFLSPLCSLFVLSLVWGCCHPTGAHAQTVFTHDGAGGRISQEAAGAPAAPQITVAPTNQTGRIGGTAQFSVVATGPGPFAYEWFKDGVPIAEATSDTLVLTGLVSGSFTPTPNSSPKYYVRVTNAHGSDISTSAELYLDTPGAGLPDWWRQQYFGTGTNDAWDGFEGNNITTATAQGTGDLRNMFGGNYSSPEAGVAFFSDGQAAGYVHAVEFERPTSISLAGYKLKVGDDSGTGNRGISEFRLYYWNTTTNTFQLLDTYVPPAHPYAGTAPGAINILEVTRNVTAVAASKFRAEFVQWASGSVGGPRVYELDAILSAAPAVNPYADADGDGVTNGQEYSDGTAPNNAASRQARITFSGRLRTATLMQADPW